MSYNEIQRLQQLAGIITEIKVFDPILNKQTLPNLIQLKRDNGIEFVDINPEIIYNLVEENPGLFGIRGDKSSVFRFVKNLAEKIYNTWEYDDYEKYKNITVGQLIDFVKGNNINEIKINNPIITSEKLINLLNEWDNDDIRDYDRKIVNILKSFKPEGYMWENFQTWVDMIYSKHQQNLYKELMVYLK